MSKGGTGKSMGNAPDGALKMSDQGSFERPAARRPGPLGKKAARFCVPILTNATPQRAIIVPDDYRNEDPDIVHFDRNVANDSSDATMLAWARSYPSASNKTLAFFVSLACPTHHSSILYNRHF